MAAQILPIIKAIAPYIAQIAAAAIPAFTAKKEGQKADTSDEYSVISKQIEELQSAASQNSQSLHLLAENLQQAMKDIEVTARDADKKITKYKMLVISSFSLSFVSMATCLYLLLR